MQKVVTKTKNVFKKKSDNSFNNSNDINVNVAPVNYRANGSDDIDEFFSAAEESRKEQHNQDFPEVDSFENMGYSNKAKENENHYPSFD